MSTNPPLTCNASQSLALIVDIQSRLTPAMADDTLADVLTASEKLLRGAQALGIPSIVTEQYPSGLGHTLESLQGLFNPFTQTVEKSTFSAVKTPEFLRLLEMSQRRQVVICGMEAHVCVLQTALDLVAKGYQVFVVEEGVCSRNDKHKQNALARLRQAGVCISNMESVLFEWLEDAQHEAFKSISKELIK